LLRVLLDSDIRSYSDASQKHQQGPRHGTHEDNELEGIEEDVVGVSGEGRIDLLPEVREKRDRTKETQKELLWIWRTSPIPTTAVGAEQQGDENNDLLHCEWAKSRACTARALEEVLLVCEMC
jgi:hypothetical protein